MSIRLNKVARDLNVGIQTAVEFLQKKGFTVEANPNTKITDEQYALLVKEFSKDKNLKLESESISLERHKEKSKATSATESEEGNSSSAIKEEPKELKTIIPETQRPKVVGQIDLDALNRPKSSEHKKENPVEKKEPVKSEENKVEVKTKEEKPEPAVSAREEVKPTEEENKLVAEPKQEVVSQSKPEPQIVEPKVKEAVVEQEVKEKKEVEESHEDEVFTINRPAFTSNINVVGKIDLDALNQQTRPKKKTKEEKRKERESKEKQRQESHKAAGGDDTNQQGGERRKRQRISKEKVDISKSISSMGGQPSRGGNGKNNGGNRPNKQKQRPIKAEVSEEDVQKQIKETLARLTNNTKGQKKSAKWRKEKREAFSNRERELAEMEEAESKVLKLTEFVTANDLASMMNVQVNEVIATCMSIGMMVSINQRLDAETINIVAEEFGFKTEYVSAEVVEAIKADEEDDNEEDWVARPPIVTVMGHVDHGKTSLLDNIRNANVIAGEAGGITQHIGAYNVKLQSGRRITFLDTPGHEAFTAMRARGAKVTDIAIIIVAADDNVMPQTVEAINHASAAGVPIVFAINKIDKPHANPDKIKEELANMNYLVEDWGGKYQSQEISAKKGIGVEDLLEKVLLEADLLDLKANPKRRAVGSIIESSLDKGRGYVSTVLVENGTLKVGDIVLAGTHFGRVKAMFNERNQRIEKAGPSEPALILGLNGAPQAGDTFNVLETDQEAREIANRREQLQRELGLRTQKMLTLDDIGRRIAVGNFQELNVIVKGDVDGSVEALSDSLIRLSTEEIQVNVIHKAVGQISESDVVLAAASDAIIIGFQVRPALPARRLAEKEGVEIRLYSIIYDAIEEVKSAMEGMLSPEIKEEITANVEVLQVFKITKVGTIAGCMVREGKIKRSNKVRVIRDGIVVHSGELESLKRFKDDVKEVVAGLDCGLNIVNYNDIQVGDIIEAYEETEIKKTL